MLRVIENLRRSAALDDLAAVDHDGLVGELTYDRQVVTEQEYETAVSSRMSASRLSTCAWIETSSAATDSSRIRTRGSAASARAIATRWRCPPESARGSARPRARPARPVRAARRRGRARPPASRPWCSGAPRRCAALDGLPRVEAGVRVLEDDLHLAAAAAASRARPGRRGPVAPARGDRARRSGRSRPTIIRAMVVLPEPDSPTMADRAARRDAERDVVDGDAVRRTPCAGRRPRQRGHGGPATRATSCELGRVNLGRAQRSATAAPSRRPSRRALRPARSSRRVRARAGRTRTLGRAPRRRTAGGRGSARSRSAVARCPGRAAASAGGVGVQRIAVQQRGRPRTSTIRPAYITAVRSQTAAASSRSWVMNSIARPQLACAGRRGSP